MIPNAVIAWAGFAVSYLWLGQMHWDRMFLLDPHRAECPLDRARLEGDPSLIPFRITFLALWPFLLLLGVINAWIRDRR